VHPVAVKYVEKALSWAGPLPLRLLAAWTAQRRTTASAQNVALAMGFTSRHQLARALQRDGLPPFEYLTAWFSVINWLVRAEEAGISLCELTIEDARDPAVRYRSVKRMTGKGWAEVRTLGSRWLVGQFADACVAHHLAHAAETGSMPRPGTAAMHAPADWRSAG
jgi:hypothetical protein